MKCVTGLCRIIVQSKLCFCLVILLMFCGQSMGYAATAAEELAELFAQTNTMHADFEQRTVGKKDGISSLQARGQIDIVRPGKLKWRTLHPTQQVVTVNNGLVWVYDIDLQQATKQKVNSKQPDNPAVLLSSDPTELQNFFTITKTAVASDVIFKLVPKSSDSMYKFLQLKFISGQLKSIHIDDNLGQKCEIIFDKVMTNQAIDPKIFIFVPPRGIDVLEPV